MSIGHLRALRLLHRAFGGYPAGHRVHILIRYFTCPFLRTVEDIPMNARVLEVGAGHGLYARLIVEERAREVIAVDPDLRKSFLPSPSPKIRKIAGYDDCIRGAFDVVVVYDVAYRMPPDVQRAFFTRAFERLVPGGTLVFKDLEGGRWKTKWATFQEWLSDNFLHITAGQGLTYPTREEVGAMLRAIGFVDFRARDIDRGYPHPHIIYTARKPRVIPSPA